MLQQGGERRLLRITFSLSAVSGLQCRFRIWKAATSAQLGTSQALQPIFVKAFRVPNLEVCMGHAVLRLRDSAELLLGVVFRDTGFTAVIEALHYHSESAYLKYDVSFEDNRKTGILGD